MIASLRMLKVTIGLKIRVCLWDATRDDASSALGIFMHSEQRIHFLQKKRRRKEEKFNIHFCLLIHLNLSFLNNNLRRKILFMKCSLVLSRTQIFWVSSEYERVHHRALDIRTSSGSNIYILLISMTSNVQRVFPSIWLWFEPRASTNAHFSERERASIERFEVRHNITVCPRSFRTLIVLWESGNSWDRV